jgi:hypothetical protein
LAELDKAFQQAIVAVEQQRPELQQILPRKSMGVSGSIAVLL